jgi:NAD dependent epimerase/dehydratase family enzyme
MNILITGGTGLVGQHLSRFLVEKGYDITILSRSARQSDNPKISYATWSPDAGTIDAEAIRSADHIIHLAGENVAEKGGRKKGSKTFMKAAQKVVR